MPTTQPGSDILPLFQTVQQFYETSFQHLLWFLAVVFGIVGVLVPLGLEWYRSRANRRERSAEKAELTNEIRAEITKSQKELYAEIRAEMEKSQAGLLETVNKAIHDKDLEWRRGVDSAVAGVLHVQATASERNKELASAAHSFARSTVFSVTANKQENARSSLGGVIRCLKIIHDNREQLEERTPGEIRRLKELIEKSKLRSELAPQVEKAITLLEQIEQAQSSRDGHDGQA